MAYVLPSHSFTAVFNIGETGLTVPVSLIDASDASVVAAETSVGVLETPAGSGIYSYTFAAVPATVGTYIAVANPDGAAPMVAVEFIVATDIPYIDDVPDGLIDRIRERIETDLTDDELVRIAITAQQMIVARWGADPDALTPEVVYLEGHSRTLTMLRPIDITEDVTITECDTVLTADDDYRIQHGGRTLVRLADGKVTNPHAIWGRDIKVEYVPKSDASSRTEATINLVQLAVTYEAVAVRNVGDVQTTHVRMVQEREQILNSLSPRPGLLML